jgi:hypothetical protein
MSTSASPTVASPLLPESSSSESAGVETVLSDLTDGIITIPDYQRDGDQWDLETKSLLVESIINNLTIPALFLEYKIGEDGIERSEVVDGQQRLTTLQSFHNGMFPLVNAEDAPYLSPNSIHYAGKTFEQLPPAYKQAFKKYRLTIIRLRNLGDMRLEVFRRINQGGTPLSGQDIRLAYFGEGSKSVAFIRLVGIHDKSSTAGARFIRNAEEKYGLVFPWNDALALDTWNDWWADKEIARGQTPSEMFVWSVLAAQANKMSALLNNKGALESINARFNNIIAEVLDTYCAQVKYQDVHPEVPSLLFSFEEMRDKFFPHFQSWIDFFLRQAGQSLSVGKHRLLGCVIGVLYKAGKAPTDVLPDLSSEIVNFIRSPRALAAKYGVPWPESKGRWLGEKGYNAQFQAAYNLLAKILGQ